MSSRIRTAVQVLTVAFLPGLGLFSTAERVDANWPTYQHDNSRSGATSERAPKNPRQIWAYAAPSRPIPAWDEPALWDGWSKTHHLRNRQVFDKVFHVVAADGRVYFGSSVDDQVYCVDEGTGAIQWTFFTEGPVRLAPTLSGSRLYFGSDDGFVYCVDAATGELQWKTRPGPSNRQVAGNGRVISPWAVRTSVVVVGDTAYCGAGVIPSEGVYVCALDATTGDEKWKTLMDDLPAQGYLLASLTRLYVVTARDRPIILDAKTGQRLKAIAGGTGGTYALLTGDTLFYGPSKTGNVNMIGADNRDVLASFQGNHMIVAKPYTFLQNGDELSALDRDAYVDLYAQRNEAAQARGALEEQLKEAIKEAKVDQVEQLKSGIEEQKSRIKAINQRMVDCIKWRSSCSCPFALILSDDVLIAGGDGEVIGVDAATGEQLWQRNLPGKVYGLATSAGKLYASTDAGTIHCFADGDLPDGDAADGQTDRPVRLQPYLGPIASAERIPPEIHGPFAEFITHDQVRVRWDSTEPMSSILEFGVDMNAARKWSDAEKKVQHEFVVDHVQAEVIYGFRVGGTTADGREISTDTYRFDSHFDYLPPATPDRPSPYAESGEYKALAAQMLETCGVRRGYALVVGASHGKLAYELARQSELKIVVIEPDEDRVSAMRSAFDSAGLYGTRIAVHQRDLKELRYGPFLANLIVSESMVDSGDLPTSLDALYSCLRPAGGTLFLGSVHNVNSNDFDQQRASLDLPWSKVETNGRPFWAHRRDKLPGTGEWTHQYASADNSACSQDDQIRGDMIVQWWGRPGARPMPDRGNRNPAPVSANGRLYVQGNRTLFGLDAYNGAILWSKQIPTMRRANMPRDVSNMVATDEGVMVAIGGRCVTFDGQTGERLRQITVQPASPERDYDWGYVSRIGTQLFGSSVRRGSQYMGDKGEWYEGFGTGEISRVTSDGVFSVNASSGATQWRYSGGVQINSTITMADGRMYFIESRNEAAKRAESGRLPNDVLKQQVLVCLDSTNGHVIWEKPYDFSKCEYMTYMTHGGGTLVITGTDKSSNFHTYAFDAETGEDLWQHDASDQKGHHTGQLAHPTIVGSSVYFNKHTYDLRTGKVLGVHDFNWHGCGVMSASKHTVFSRYEYHGMIDLETKKRTEFLGIRSGCWLSLIPSGGLLLAPETSAGCSCGHSLQTSIAYVPRLLVDGPQW